METVNLSPNYPVLDEKKVLKEIDEALRDSEIIPAEADEMNEFQLGILGNEKKKNTLSDALFHYLVSNRIKKVGWKITEETQGLVKFREIDGILFKRTCLEICELMHDKSINGTNSKWYRIGMERFQSRFRGIIEEIKNGSLEDGLDKLKEEGEVNPPCLSKSPPSIEPLTPEHLRSIDSLNEDLNVTPVILQDFTPDLTSIHSSKESEKKIYNYELYPEIIKWIFLFMPEYRRWSFFQEESQEPQEEACDLWAIMEASIKDRVIYCESDRKNLIDVYFKHLIGFVRKRVDEKVEKIEEKSRFKWIRRRMINRRCQELNLIFDAFHVKILVLKSFMTNCLDSLVHICKDPYNRLNRMNKYNF